MLANITESCHIGCDGCYKGSMVRTTLLALETIDSEKAKLKKQLSIVAERAVLQARLLAMWLNNHSEVDTVIVSGGEPTLFSNQALKQVFEEYKKAKFVRVVRVCTSSIFQGMWYRVDDGFVDFLSAFERESGKKVYVNAHVTDEFQLGAPEAAMALKKIQSRGLLVCLQMPLQQGINFDRNDLEWSVKKLKSICKRSYGLGVIPYKLILDMHSPTNPDATVPIEVVCKAISFLDSHLDQSDHERWQAYNILHPQGNLYLSSWPHFSAVKEIDVEKKLVTYFIPKTEYAGGRKISVHTYFEPLIAGMNDDVNSLGKIGDIEVLEKIKLVKTAYSDFKAGLEEALKLSGFSERQKRIEELTLEFYNISGILLPKNEPLVVAGGLYEC